MQQELTRFEVVLLVPTASWIIEAADEDDALMQVTSKPDYQIIVNAYGGEPHNVCVIELDD